MITGALRSIPTQALLVIQVCEDNLNKKYWDHEKPPSVSQTLTKFNEINSEIASFKKLSFLQYCYEVCYLRLKIILPAYCDNSLLNQQIFKHYIKEIRCFYIIYTDGFKCSLGVGSSYYCPESFLPPKN